MNKGVKKYRMSGKKSSHRDAIITSLVIELIRAEKIKTTPNKGKIVKAEFDKLVTKVKLNTESSKRKVEGYFGSKDVVVTKLYKIVSEKLQDRNSGYTYSARTLSRKGDNAEQMYVMIVNAEEKEKKSKLQKALEKREVVKEETSVAGRLKKAVGSRTAKKDSTKGVKKKEDK